MKKQPAFQFILISLFTALTACKEGRLNDTTPAKPFAISSFKLLDYDSQSIHIQMTGQLKIQDVAAYDALTFFESPGCQGPSIGEVLVKDFDSQGVTLSLTSNHPRPLFVSTQNSSDCLVFFEYSGLNLKPGAAALSQSSPESPSRDSYTPGLFGEAFPPSAQVDFYSDSSCTQVVGQGSTAEFASVGIGVSLTPNQTTTIYAKVTDSLGQSSSCAKVTDYTHRNTPLDNPVFVSITPFSPNNMVLTPVIRGSLSPEAVSVTLYSDSSCETIMATGTSEEFSSNGLEVTVAENASTNIYAKSVDDLGNRSGCALLTNYIHDTLPPTDPSYNNISPGSPNNSDTFPQVSGSSSSDTLSLRFYNSFLCLEQIGSGSRTQFQNTGVTANVKANSTTSIFARAYDPAGNGSACTHMTDYKHNTIAPNSPTFSATDPSSPTNQSITPLIRGTGAQFTYELFFYDDETCANLVGSGPTADYESSGISLSLQENLNNMIYVRVRDLEGNYSSCEFHANYDHSTQPAQEVGFLFSFPGSPTNNPSPPYIVGSANNRIVKVSLYEDSFCTSLLGTGTRAQYSSSGIQISVAQNSTTDIYAISENDYGNTSSCHYITTFIHNDIDPDPPVFIQTDPVSPHASSTSPQVTGTATTPESSQLPPSVVRFYDSPACVNKIGEGTPDEFSGVGIRANVAANTTTNIYGKVLDAASNSSPCTFLTDYTHDSYKPGVPVFTASTPASPSYTSDISITGYFASSPDFLSMTSVGIYSDSSCESLLASGSPSEYENSGIELTVASNATTALYAASVNEVGTSSDCRHQTDFVHSDSPPQNLSLSNQFDGGVYASWLPDLSAKPAPTYAIERSLSPSGPFAVIGSSLVSNTYTDKSVNAGTTYYYRVYAANSTGRSLYSPVQSITTSSNAPVDTSTLSAYPGTGEVRLTWGGNVRNMTYKIYRAAQPGGPYALLVENLTTSLYIDTTVADDTSYYYVVTGRNPSGESMQSNMASVHTKPLPPAPINFIMRVTASAPECAGGVGMYLSWGPSQYHDGYAIMRGGLMNGANTSSYATTASLKHTLCSPINGTYAVSARWGSKYSQTSNSISYYAVESPTLIASPGDSHVHLEWNEPSDNNGRTLIQENTVLYDIYRAPQPDGVFDKIASDLSGRSYTDSSAAQNQAYYYYVQSHITQTDGDYYIVGPHSDVQVATPASLPASPSNLKLLTESASGSVTLEWSAPSHYTGFNVYRAADPGGPYSVVARSPSNRLPSAPTATGMNYFYVTATWGTQQTSGSNIVSTRQATFTGLSATPDDSQILVTWNPISDVQNYNLFRANTKSGPYVLVSSPSTNSYTDTSLSPNIGYFYKVSAEFADGTESQKSSPVSAMLTSSTKPTGLELTLASGNLITATWVPLSNVDSQEIYSALSASGPWTLRSTVPAGSNEALLSGLSLNTEHFVKVRAKTESSNFDSDISSIYLYSIPPAPAVVAGDSEFNLSWTPMSGALDYDLLRSTDGANFAPVVSNHSTSSYLDTGVNNGQSYFYKLRVNFSDGSVESEATTAFTPGIYPLAPQSLIAKNNGTGTEVLLTWDLVPGAKSYHVYSSTSSGSYSTPRLTSSVTSDVVINGLSSGTTYYFIVKALIGSLESPQSPETSVQAGLPPAAPSLVWGGAASVDISWSAVTGAASYDLLRSENGVDFYQLAGPMAGTSYTDNTVESSKTYFYRYQPTNSSGALIALSDVSRGISTGHVPSQPQGLRAASSDNATVDLDWITTSRADYYEVLRAGVSGGPYSSLGTVSSPNLSYTDTTTVTGNTYYYVIRALTSEGAPSSLSSEVSMALVGRPVNLTASSSGPQISLSWDSLDAASSYRILRSNQTGGPYGLVGTAASASFLDNDVIPQKTYYYVVQAVLPAGELSPISDEASVTHTGSLNLQVPIELTDTRLASSNISSLAFSRTQTSLDTNDYDGVTSYEFEVIAKNTDSGPKDIELIDESGINAATISIPSGVIAFTRYRVTFTPNTGAETYRIKLDQTSAEADLVVNSSRLLVNQVNATKTKLYFPLFSLSREPTSQDNNVAVVTTNSTDFQSSPFTLPFLRETTSLAHLVDYNAWELEALLSRTGSARGSAALVNQNSQSIVGPTQTVIENDAIMISKTPFSDGIQFFDATHEGELYELQVRCDQECDTGQVSVHKAGLWVRLENLTKSIAFFRNASTQSQSNSELQITDDRTLIDLSSFSNPQVFFQADLSDDANSSADVILQSHTGDSGGSGLDDVAGSMVSINSDSRELKRTSSAISINTNDRFTTKVLPSGGFVRLFSSAIVVKCSIN